MRFVPGLVVFALGVGAAACSGSGDGAAPAATTSGTPTTPTSATTAPPPSSAATPTIPTLPSPPPTAAADGNYLADPGFEDAASLWVSLKPPDWERVTDVVRSGAGAAKLPFDVAGPPDGGPEISYLVQEVTAEPFPETVAGWYRVDNWVRGAAKQYLQFVVIVIGADNAPDIDWSSGTEFNHQLRYPLAGIREEPFEIGNAHFVFVGRDDPVEGEWVFFERPVADDFRSQWGAVPAGYSRIRLLLEVRVDDTPESRASADVYYDDIFLGTRP